MFSWLFKTRVIYILSNLLVIPATLIPGFDLLSNLSFTLSFFLLFNKNLLLTLVVSIILVIKNNSNYRFNLLLKIKGNEISKSDPECVYLYAWCTFLRYFLIGIATYQIVIFFK